MARFFFISKVAAASYAPRLRIPPRKQVVVDNPFAIDDYVAERSPEVARELGVEGGGPVLLHIGRLTPWKGQDVLLRALPEVLASIPDARVVLLGRATEGKHERFPDELRALVDELGIGGHVVFAGARRDVASVLALADVVVHCSTTPEPFGRVIVEAMAAGRPVVAADAGGVPEIVEPGETGLLVPPSDPSALAAAIVRVLGDPAAAAAMGERGRRSAERRFSIGAHAEVVQANYDEVLRGA